MRKNQLKLIKRTEHWLHRKKGTDSLSIPENINSDSITRFVILGSCEGEADGALRGVGSFDESSGKYLIHIHAHGKNLLGGREFAEEHMKRQICTVSKPSLTETNYTFIPDVDKNGAPIIDGSVIKFKEKTAYTLAFTAKYIAGTKPRDLKLTFEYTDGTSFTPSFDTVKKTITDCVSSDPEKTISCISCYVGNHLATIFVLADFGIYEGIHTDHGQIHEAYVGSRTVIELDAPLYSIGYASDELDLKSGTLIRKIKRFRVDSSASISETEDEGVFRIELDAPMRSGGKTVSVYGELSEDADYGICASDDGAAILFKPPEDITDTDSLRAFLEPGAFDVFYILETPSYTTADIASPNLSGKSAVDIGAEIAPRKCFVEYY